MKCYSLREAVCPRSAKPDDTPDGRFVTKQLRRESSGLIRCVPAWRSTSALPLCFAEAAKAVDEKKRKKKEKQTKAAEKKKPRGQKRKAGGKSKAKTKMSKKKRGGKAAAAEVESESSGRQ